MTNVANRDDSAASQPELSPELVQRFAQMATLIPEDDGSAIERILTQILDATEVDQLDAPWDVTKARQLAGKLLRVDALKRQPSSFTGGLRIFLVVSYTDTGTGEQAVFTTSSLSVVAQLVRAYAISGVPFYIELVIADKPTADGYYPHHLRLHPAPQGT